MPVTTVKRTCAYCGLNLPRVPKTAPRPPSPAAVLLAECIDIHVIRR